MAQLKKVVEPFGEVNVYPAAGNRRGWWQPSSWSRARGHADRHCPRRLRLNGQALRGR
jgi:hypothetical protein